MKVSAWIEQLQQLNPDFDIGLADEEKGVVEIRAIESDVMNETYRIV